MAKVVFAGGNGMLSYLGKIAQRLSSNPRVDVGFLEGSTYPDGTSVPTVAAIQEFGAPASNIPPRPFFRQMIAKESGHWGEDLGDLLIANKLDAAKSLGQMGKIIKSELQDSIEALVEPASAPATVAKKKGRGKELIDTGFMKESVDFEVKA